MSSLLGTLSCCSCDSIDVKTLTQVLVYKNNEYKAMGWIQGGIFICTKCEKENNITINIHIEKKENI